MASVIWDVGRELKESYIALFELVNNKDNYTKEQLLEAIENEAKGLKSSYQDLASDHGWDGY